MRTASGASKDRPTKSQLLATVAAMAPSLAIGEWHAATSDLDRRAGAGKYEQPLATKPISVVIAIISCCILACFTVNKARFVTDWCRLPYIQWLVLIIYAMSFAFVLGSSILQFGSGSDLNYDTCSATIILCLSAYVATKVFIYLFLVDRVHIVRESRKLRLKSKLYLTNSFGMMGM